MSESIENSAKEKEAKGFSDLPDSPASAHRKKIAKADSRAKLKKEASGIELFTRKGNKILRVVVTAGGTYSSYIGRADLPKNKAEFESALAKWKSAGAWVSEDGLKEKVQEIRKGLKG